MSLTRRPGVTLLNQPLSSTIHTPIMTTDQFETLQRKLVPLWRPRLIEYIRSLIVDFDRAHLVPYNTTPIDRDLALRLGIPLYGADPKYFPLVTKSGARRIFAEEGVPHPLGIENLRTPDDIVDAVLQMRA